MLCYGQDVLMFNHIAMLVAITKVQSDMTASTAVRIKGTEDLNKLKLAISCYSTQSKYWQDKSLRQAQC